MHSITGPVTWPVGPPTEQVAELVRTLELTINRRLDGALHGNHQGITPGHGSEPGESRLYQPGDDVRRIDWNVTARTSEPHVRVDLAERALVTWLVLDNSPSMEFGTADRRKADVAEGVSIAVGHLATRRGNRLGVVSFGPPGMRSLPPRQGRVGLLGLLGALRDGANGTTGPETAGPPRTLMN